MSQRFNKEPINLIHRIPSQKQIDDARPVPPPYGQFLLDAGAVCWRKIVEFLSQVTRYEDEKSLSVQATVASQSSVAPAVAKPDQVGERVIHETLAEERAQEAGAPASHETATLQLSAVTPTFVQPAEVAELRAFLLRQQEDITRLSTQIQELTSLVASQQQVLVHLGEELEAGTFSMVAGGSAAASVKRSRIVRKKPSMKDEPIPHKESQGPSLNL
jgi:hypothetical protein